MCVAVTEPEVLTKALEVKKIAPFGYSQYSSFQRTSIPGFNEQGEQLRYEVYTTVRSPRGPGIMAWLPGSENGVIGWDYYQLKDSIRTLRIPAGATVRYGLGHDGKRDGSICASVVEVIA